ncbi:SH3 domain protein [Candidatus Vecturithrix granuli]|uniref:SH3 domain protein n=1 Tax=Vecturithrix granuli TaxID=1499967 RepID=A0A081BWS8_VECG1|nr:SH3 domain protein [Candidatus Vecturithrix granuli]
MDERPFFVVEAYTKSAVDPIMFNKGDTLVIGELYQDDPEWPGWIWCCHPITGKAGWVPQQYLRIQDRQGIALCDYSANELTVLPGDTLLVSTQENGWAWAQNTSDEYGWVPLRHIQPII